MAEQARYQRFETLVANFMTIDDRKEARAAHHDLMDLIDNERELGNQTLVKRMQDKMRRDIAKLYTDWRKCFAASRAHAGSSPPPAISTHAGTSANTTRLPMHLTSPSNLIPAGASPETQLLMDERDALRARALALTEILHKKAMRKNKKKLARLAKQAEAQAQAEGAQD